MQFTKFHCQIIIKLYDSFIDGNNCENAEREFDAMQIANDIERKLNTIYTKNRTSIGSSCLNTKPLLHSCDGEHNEKNGEYLMRIRAFNKIIILIYIFKIINITHTYEYIMLYSLQYTYVKNTYCRFCETKYRFIDYSNLKKFHRNFQLYCHSLIMTVDCHRLK